MVNDLKILKEAFSLFATDKDGVFLQGKFQDFFANLKLWPNVGSKHKRVLSQLFKFVIEDLWNISQIIDRIEWTRHQLIDDENSKYRWMYYASLDVQSIHYEIRSIMDYMAQAIGDIYNIPRKKSESFERLVNWSKKNPDKIDKEIEELLRSASWFGQIRGIRNLFLHLGGSALVFGEPKDGILFQIYKEDLYKVIDSGHLPLQ
jgi:predicted ATPase